MRIALVATLVMVGFVGLILLGVFVWPTAYKYDTMALRQSAISDPEPTMVRTNRFTGETAYLTRYGWVSASAAPASTGSAVAVDSNNRYRDLVDH